MINVYRLPFTDYRLTFTENTRSVDENVGAPLVGAHENISRVEPNENNQGTHKGCPYGVVTLGVTVGGTGRTHRFAPTQGGAINRSYAALTCNSVANNFVISDILRTFAE